MYPLTADDPRDVGPYRLLALLGSGGMGHVYLGVDRTDRHAAVKVVRSELAYDPSFRERFAHELELAGRVRGPHLTSVYTAGPREEIPWLATEYVPGPSLQELVERVGPLPDSAALILARGVAHALTGVHAAGAAHRDLKPGNVLVAPDGPRVIDFGIARAVEDAQETEDDEERIVGTPGYMAPEVLRGAAGGPPADVFALAGVLVFALTGSGPFGDGHPSTVLYRTEHATPSLNGTPPFLHRLLKACLDRNPDRRPSMDLVLETLGGPLTTLPAARRWLPEPAADAVEEVGRAYRKLLRGTDHGRDLPGYRTRSLLTGSAATIALALVAGFGLWSHSLSFSSGPEDLAAAEETEEEVAEEAPGLERCDPRDLADVFVQAAAPEPSIPGADQDDLVGQLSFAPDGSVLAVGGSDGIALWDWRERTEIGRIDLYLLQDSYALPTFSPDGCRVAYPDGDGLHLYTLATGEYEVLFEGNPMWSMAFSPDGRTLAASSAGQDSLHVLDLHSGERTDFQVGEIESGGSVGFRQIVYSPGGDRLAATGTWGLWVWDTTTWEVIDSVSDAFLPLDSAGALAMPDDDGVVYMDRDGPMYADLSIGRTWRYAPEDDAHEGLPGNMREFAYHPVTDSVHSIHLVLNPDGSGGTAVLGSWDRAHDEPWELTDLNLDEPPMAMTAHPEEEVLVAVAVERGEVMLLDSTTLRFIEYFG